jgi:hypothetical protein
MVLHVKGVVFERLFGPCVHIAHGDEHYWTTATGSTGLLPPGLLDYCHRYYWNTAATGVLAYCHRDTELLPPEYWTTATGTTGLMPPELLDCCHRDDWTTATGTTRLLLPVYWTTATGIYWTTATGISGHFSTTVTKAFPCFLLNCKASAMV